MEMFVLTVLPLAVMSGELSEQQLAGDLGCAGKDKFYFRVSQDSVYHDRENKMVVGGGSDLGNLGN